MNKNDGRFIHHTFKPVRVYCLLKGAVLPVVIYYIPIFYSAPLKES